MGRVCFVRTQAVVNRHEGIDHAHILRSPRLLSTAFLVAMLLLLGAGALAGPPDTPSPGLSNRKSPTHLPKVRQSRYMSPTTTELMPSPSTPSKAVEWAEIAFVPGSGSGSGQLVFIEFYSVKLLTFTVTPSGLSTSSIVTLATEPTLIHYVSVSPVTAAGQFVLYGVGHPDNTTTIKVVSIAGGQITPVDSGNLGDAVWSRDLTRIAVLIGNPQVAGVVQQIEMLNLDSSFVAGSCVSVAQGPGFRVTIASDP